MKKSTAKSEYFKMIKALKLIILLVLMTATAICMSACITVQAPDNNESGNTQTQDGTGTGDQTNPDGQEGSESGTDAGTGGSSGSGSGGSSGSGSGSSSGSGDGSIDGPAISEAQAVYIVLGRVKGSTRNDIIEFELDYDDGRWDYEGKIRGGGVVYEFEIDGQNGNILEWEVDD